MYNTRRTGGHKNPPSKDLIENDVGSGDNVPVVNDRIVELLNCAAMEPNWKPKLDSLAKVQELLLHNDPNLLDNFLDEVLSFQNDRSPEVRKFLIGFIEAGCRKDKDILPKVITNIRIFMEDEVLGVRKRVYQAMSNIYTNVLEWICKAKAISNEMDAVWKTVVYIKERILELLDSDNEGTCPFVVKFMEVLIIAQTLSEVGGDAKNSFGLEQIPLTLKLVRPRKLEEEAMQAFDDLVKYHCSSHISCPNLLVCMMTFKNIANARPTPFLGKVVTALEMLHATLPPTLSRSQVTTVRKALKNHLMSLLKLQITNDSSFLNVCTLLQDLGVSKEELIRVVPRFDEIRRRARKERQRSEVGTGSSSSSKFEPSSKRPKVEEEEEGDSDDEELNTQSHSAVDVNEKFVMERLNPLIAAEMVMRFIKDLPEEIPARFQRAYTPIAEAGTESQIRHVARLLAAQMAAKNIGPGSETAKLPPKSTALKAEDEDDEMTEKNSGKISTIISGTLMDVGIAKEEKTITLMPSGFFVKKSIKKSLKLADITKRMNSDEANQQALKAITRILKAEKFAALGGVSDARTKIITTLVARSPPDVKASVLNFLIEDIKARMDLAFSWLYEEYCFCQSFHRAQWNRRTDDTEYNELLCHLISGVLEKTEGVERDNLMTRLYLESPMITQDAIELLKKYVLLKDSAATVVNLVKDLVQLRPTKKLTFFNFLLEYCSHEVTAVRDTAISTVQKLYKSGEHNDLIEGYAILYLQFLMSSAPPQHLFGPDRGRTVITSYWTESAVKACLYLFISLLPLNLGKLFPNLTAVFSTAKFHVVDSRTERGSTIAHCIIRELQEPISKVSMDNPDLLDIIGSTTEDNETLVSRVIHILTEKNVPSQNLVDKVKEVYQSKNMDIRFLIPVLGGLSKQEVLVALPKLIKLSSPVVKEIFTRLWTSGPLNKVDLLIALHNIDVLADKADMRAVLQATQICFQEKHVYTPEVLSIVLQQLSSSRTIPVLFMRTVLQTQATYPSLQSFVLNILQTLILKQIWKDKSLWNGFIKCCEKLIPHSYAVILQLPPANLEDFFQALPHIRDPLLEHVQNLSDAQRAHISQESILVLYNQESEVQTKREEDISNQNPT